MEVDTGRNYYEEAEVAPVARVGVQDARAFIKAMLDLFRNNGTLYISSYDFGYWAGELSHFRSAERVKLNTSLPDAAFLENGYSLTDDFIYVFSVECLNSVDPKSMFNQFLIYQKGTPVLQCCCNFEEVYVNTKLPKTVIDKLMRSGVIASWEKR
ncbi:MAG: hypothetical protein NC938_06220 [Candidatus Omnitrophica bacterium]|nr:hypothetical protein [Candidatus Omnitrophota bacterium]